MCGAAAGLYRERGEAAFAGGERSREGKGGRRRRFPFPFPPWERGRLGACGAGGGGVAMASMAAAIAASRTAVMNGNRPLDERERKRFSYFSSLSPMARKIMAEKERIRERYGPEWERLPPRQQDEIIDKCLVEPHVQARYAAHRGAARPAAPPASYPSLRLNTGQKVVRFGDEVPPPRTETGGRGAGGERRPGAGGARPSRLSRRRGAAVGLGCVRGRGSAMTGSGRQGSAAGPPPPPPPPGWGGRSPGVTGGFFAAETGARLWRGAGLSGR